MFLFMGSSLFTNQVSWSIFLELKIMISQSCETLETNSRAPGLSRYSGSGDFPDCAGESALKSGFGMAKVYTGSMKRARGFLPFCQHKFTSCFGRYTFAGVNTIVLRFKNFEAYSPLIIIFEKLWTLS